MICETMGRRLRHRIMRILRQWVLLCGGLWVCCMSAQAQTAQRVTGEVVDENGVAVSDARINLTSSEGSANLQCRTGPTGLCALAVPITGSYSVRIEKENFYVTEAHDVHFNPAMVSQFT